jgi:hypothetical protein
MEENDKVQTSKDWENRILCSDESCIGVIGSDGHCKECGLLFNGDLKNDKLNGNEYIDRLDSEPDQDIADEESTAPMDKDWETRTLCRDGNCIGVVGPDDKCKECGLLYNKE